MTLRDMLSGYVHRMAGNPMHYVPSFNDMCTGVQDEGMEDEAKRPNASPPHSPIGTGTRAASAPASMGSAPSGRPAPTGAMPMSNKTDAWPAFDAVDIHKVNVARTFSDRRHLYDLGHSPGDHKRGPSVWEYQVQSDKAKSSDGRQPPSP